MTYGQRIRQARESLGLTQQEVATLAGISGQYLCDIEYGRRAIPEHVAQRIQAALHLPTPLHRMAELEAAIRWYTGNEPDEILADYRAAQADAGGEESTP